MEHKEHFHGSDLEAIEKAYHIKKEDIISFSANVNPLGVSYKLKESLIDHIDAITTYPDREYTSLRKAIATYTNTKYENIILGNGSTELISLLIQHTCPKRALILAPCYSEYERELNLSGGIIEYYRLEEKDNFEVDLAKLEEALCNDIDLFVICNPNNPTSTAIRQPQMREILTLCKKKQIFVMVDETYVEFADDMDQITSIPLTEEFDNVIVLRGISKFFAAPGLRLGYAICGNESVIHTINEKKNPWTINSLAAIAGEIMFSDTEYKKETRNLIHSERNRIMKLLDQYDTIKYYPSNANFILVHILKPDVTAMDLFEAAIRKGLMLRDCASFTFLDESYFRFCFMLPEQNDRLLNTILPLLRKE